MKIGIKIVLFVLVILTSALSAGGYLMIRNNFDRLLEQTCEQQVNQHITGKHLIEKSLVDDRLQGNLFPTLEDQYDMMLDIAKEYTGAYQVAVFDESAAPIVSYLNERQHDLAVQSLSETQNGYIVYPSRDSSDYQMIVSELSYTDSPAYYVSAYDISSIFEERDNQCQYFFFLSVSLLLFCMILILVFSHTLTGPLKALTNASQSIANGAYDQRTRIRTTDEIGILSQNFDHMADTIESKIQHLSEMNQNKEEFIESFSHELKTPMTAIMGYADMLRNQEQEPEVQIRAADTIFKESKRISDLSLKLMDLFSISDEYVERIPVPAGKILAPFSSDFEPAQLIADPILIDCVLRNLTQNSKNAGAQRIQVTGTHGLQRYRIEVSDDGCGIPPEKIQRVTEPFYMVDKSRSRGNGGSGLGLTLCQKILQLHGTELHIASAEGKGTQIHFFLEVKQDEDQ